MNSPEFSVKEPSPYTDLFNKFKLLVMERGVINHGPLDHFLHPGDDGTVTPEGGEAVGYDLELPADSIPDSLRQQGISKISIGTYSATVMEGNIWEERTWIAVEESIGLTSYYIFYKHYDTEDVSLRKTVDAGIETESGKIDYNDIDKNEIIDRLFNGDLRLLSDEGLAGTYARSVYLSLSNPDDGSVEDVETLYRIFSDLEAI